MKTYNKTMLTVDLLDRFEAEGFTADLFTDSDIKWIEHAAYVAMMNNHNGDTEDAYTDFYRVMKIHGINPTTNTNNDNTKEDETMTTTTETKTTEQITKEIIAYFEENEDVFNDCIEELDSYNGYLGDDRYYSMDELDELYSGTEPTEILRRAFYGHDAETFTTDERGERTYGEFNPNRDYFTFNGYGNLVSADHKDYSAHIDHWAVESMLENRQYIDSIDRDDTLCDLFDALETA